MHGIVLQHMSKFRQLLLVCQKAEENSPEEVAKAGHCLAFRLPLSERIVTDSGIPPFLAVRS